MHMVAVEFESLSVLLITVIAIAILDLTQY